MKNVFFLMAMKKSERTKVRITLAIIMISLWFSSSAMANSWQRILTCDNGEFGTLAIDTLVINGQRTGNFQAVIVGQNPVANLFSPISAVSVPNVLRLDSGNKVVVGNVGLDNATYNFTAADGSGKIQLFNSTAIVSIFYVGREPAFGRNWQFNNCN